MNFGTVEWINFRIHQDPRFPPWENHIVVGCCQSTFLLEKIHFYYHRDRTTTNMWRKFFFCYLDEGGRLERVNENLCYFWQNWQKVLSIYSWRLRPKVTDQGILLSFFWSQQILPNEGCLISNGRYHSGWFPREIKYIWEKML
jgi:hypothetical protein